MAFFSGVMLFGIAIDHALSLDHLHLSSVVYLCVYWLLGAGYCVGFRLLFFLLQKSHVI